MPATYEELLTNLSQLITDYRIQDQNEAYATERTGIPVMDVEHVLTWIEQFDAGVREGVLRATYDVLNKTYVSKDQINIFLRGLLHNPGLTGGNSQQFWSGVNLLQLQTVGNSQCDFLALLKEHLLSELNIEHSGVGTSHDSFLYLDDISFSGGRILSDLLTWIETAPNEATVNIVVLVNHTYGEWYVQEKLNEKVADCNKNITFTWWRYYSLENRTSRIESSDVLRPRLCPELHIVQDYYQNINSEENQIVFRRMNGVGSARLFPDGASRNLLEQEFLKKGVQIRADCPNLNVYQRPLGNMLFPAFGFGSMFVTYRNCPNNTPLVFWVGSPWYPLFPRVTN